MDSNLNTSYSSTGRRFFIKKTLLGAGVLVFAQFLPLGCSRTPPSLEMYEEMEFFKSEEAYLLSHIAGRIIPLTDNDQSDLHDVIVRLDRYFIEAYPEDQKQFSRLLTVFNNPIFVFLFSGSFTSFDRMPDVQKDAYLRGWMTSIWKFRRTAFQALKRLIMSMHYTRDESWIEIGFGGPII